MSAQDPQSPSIPELAEHPCPNCGQPMLAAWGSTCGRCKPKLAYPKTVILTSVDVQGVLRASWADRLGGMQIKPDEGNAGCTLLEGALPDQAALLGILQGLYDLGLPLLLVEWVETVDSIEQRTSPTADTGGRARPVEDDDAPPF